jgi:hypothetical protein
VLIQFQLQDDIRTPEEMVSFSLFPRITPLEDELQMDGTLNVVEVRKPKYIPILNGEEPVNELEFDDESDEDEVKPDLEDMKLYRDRYLNMDDRVSRILSLYERISSRHDQVRR